MAFSFLRSCVKSIGVSRQLIVLESKVTCLEPHAPGPLTIASKIRAFSSFTRRTRTRSNALNPPVIEAFQLGSSIISLEMIDDEKNHGSVLCHMDGTTVRSKIIMSHDKYNDDNFLQVRCFLKIRFNLDMDYTNHLRYFVMDTFCFKVYYDETRYGERWRSHDPTDREIICSHIIDRSIRPLFTAGFPANVMV